MLVTSLAVPHCVELDQFSEMFPPHFPLFSLLFSLVSINKL